QQGFDGLTPSEPELFLNQLDGAAVGTALEALPVLLLFLENDLLGFGGPAGGTLQTGTGDESAQGERLLELVGCLVDVLLGQEVVLGGCRHRSHLLFSRVR